MQGGLWSRAYILKYNHVAGSRPAAEQRETTVRRRFHIDSFHTFLQIKKSTVQVQACSYVQCHVCLYAASARTWNDGSSTSRARLLLRRIHGLQFILSCSLVFALVRAPAFLFVCLFVCEHDMVRRPSARQRLACEPHVLT